MRSSVFFLFIFFYTAAAGQADRSGYFLLQAKEIDPVGTNYSGMNFLDTLLQNKRIVLLGESSHGTEEYSQTKLQLIRYLHERLGYNVVLFESPMMPGAYVNSATDSVSSAQLVVNTLQPFWQTVTMAQVFQYIRENNICFAGFDPQFFPSPYDTALIAAAFTAYPEIKNEWLSLEQVITQTFKKPGEYLLSNREFSAAYAALSNHIHALPLSPAEQWLRQMAAVSRGYYRNITKGNQRDSSMAKNIQWLADSLYPHEKIIVWAHNTHIDKMATSPKKLMGKLLAQHYKEQLYAVGLYMANGKTALNNRQVIDVKETLPGSLEELLLKTGFKTTFIETSDPAFNKTIPTWHWGKDKQPLNASRSYDAVILVNGVNAPEYINTK